MARPAIIFSGYDKLVPTRVETRSNGVLVASSVTEQASRRRVTVLPASISTPVVVPRPKTNFSSYSYRGSSELIGTSRFTFGSTVVSQEGLAGLSLNDVDFSDPVDRVQGLALNKALNALNDGDINLAQALGEMPQTAALVASSCARIAKQVRGFRKGFSAKDWSQVKRNLSSWRNSNGSFNHGPTDAWLELQYGWKPLAADVHGAMETVYDRARQYPATVRISKKSRDFFRSTQNMSSFGGQNVYWQVTNEVSAHAVLIYALDDPLAATFARTGISNPLLLGWELAPFSFVVDWFFPVGNFLQARAAANGWRFISGSLSSLAQMKALGEDVKLNGANYEIKSVVRPQAKGHRFYRTVFSTSPAAVPPSFKNPFSAVHVANAFALLVGAFKK